MCANPSNTNGDPPTEEGTNSRVAVQRRALSIADVCRECGLGRTSVYAAIRAGELVARKYGRRTIVLADDLVAFLRALPTAKSGDPRTDAAARSADGPRLRSEHLR